MLVNFHFYFKTTKVLKGYNKNLKLPLIQEKTILRNNFFFPFLEVW